MLFFRFCSFVTLSVLEDALVLLHLLWRCFVIVDRAMDVLIGDARIFFIALCARHPKWLSKKRAKALAERIVDAMEKDLIAICEENNLPYIRPELSDEGVDLVLKSPMRFIKTFLRELRVACRSGCGFISI